MSRQIPCFFLEPTGRLRLTLRRYLGRGDHADVPECPDNPGQYSYHNAQSDPVGEADYDPTGLIHSDRFQSWPRDDPSWPVACSCGYAFDARANFRVFCEAIYRRSDTGEETTLRDAPAGAMWYADWMLDHGATWNRGPDGHCLVVKTPGGEWMVDGRASNCGRPDDNTHHCWVRHGTAPQITVDKNGDTCSAGAGSIQAGSYHGFLRNGYLVEA